MAAWGSKTLTPRRIRNNESSPLLRLPPEMRNLIFRYALGGKKFLISRVGRKEQYLHVTTVGGESTNHFSLLRVCRQIYAETVLLPFTLSTFTFSDSWSPRLTNALGAWMQLRLPIERGSVTTIEFRFSGAAGHEAPTVESLRSLRYVIDYRLQTLKVPQLPGLKRVQVEWHVPRTIRRWHPLGVDEIEIDSLSAKEVHEVQSRVQAKFPGVEVAINLQRYDGSAVAM